LNIYIKSDKIEEKVNGRNLSKTHWATKSRPVELLLDFLYELKIREDFL